MHKHSEYMHWAKTQRGARLNLATSGVASFPLAELPHGPLELTGGFGYGYPPLQSAIARKCGVDPECVVHAAGTSMANHLAMAALLDPGDEALIEEPAYPLLVDTALYLGATVRRFPRHLENGWAIEPVQIRARITPRTRLIVLTNLHNPTSVYTPEPVLREIGEIAANTGAHVLVDEVYLDAVDGACSAVHLGPQFVTTASLTKLYGLSGLRCGWILADAALAWKIRRLDDLFDATPAHPAELLSVAAFEHLESIRARTRRVLDQDRIALNTFLDAAEHAHLPISAVRSPYGTTSFLRLPFPDADPFIQELRKQADTGVVPGRFFDTPDHIRIGFGVDSGMFREGLEQIAALLPSRSA